MPGEAAAEGTMSQEALVAQHPHCMQWPSGGTTVSASREVSHTPSTFMGNSKGGVRSLEALREGSFYATYQMRGGLRSGQ